MLGLNLFMEIVLMIMEVICNMLRSTSGMKMIGKTRRIGGKFSKLKMYRTSISNGENLFSGLIIAGLMNLLFGVLPPTLSWASFPQLAPLHPSLVQCIREEPSEHNKQLPPGPTLNSE